MLQWEVTLEARTNHCNYWQKSKVGCLFKNPEALWHTLTILVYIHTDLSLLFLTPTCQNTCNSKRTQFTEALKYSSPHSSCQCQKLFHRHGVKSGPAVIKKKSNGMCKFQRDLQYYYYYNSSKTCKSRLAETPAT